MYKRQILLSSKNLDISIDIFSVVEEFDSFFSNKVSNTSILFKSFKVTIPVSYTHLTLPTILLV
ncbi:hypothetical protein JMUB7540_28090 [Staphylococcus aureus]